jgi:hypothetical protein
MAFIGFLKRTLSPDLKVVCNDGEIYCHRLLLSSVSNFVKVLLLSSDSSTIIIPQLNLAELEDTLEVLYSEKLETKNEDYMKRVFSILCVDSKNILVKNITNDVKKLKSKRRIKGSKLLKFNIKGYPVGLCKKERVEFDDLVNISDSDVEDFKENDVLDYFVEEAVQGNHKSIDSVETVQGKSKSSSDHAYMKVDKGVPCDLCEKFCKSKKTLIEHIKYKHSEHNFPCDLCDKVCIRKENLTAHKKQKHGEERLDITVGSRICGLCQLTFKRKDILAHMRQKHPDSPLEFCCDQCQKRFKFKSKLERHRKQHDKTTDNMSCQMCDFETGSEESLKRHIRRHANLIKCDLCEYTSDRIEYVKKHFSKNHEDQEETSHRCDICERCCPTKNALKIHKKRYH